MCGICPYNHHKQKDNTCFQYLQLLKMIVVGRGGMAGGVLKFVLNYHFFFAWIAFSDDIFELYNTPLQQGHAAAFSDDCDSTSNKFAVRGAGNQVQIILKEESECYRPQFLEVASTLVVAFVLQECFMPLGFPKH